MSMFNDISMGSKDNEQECESNANLVCIYARRFSPGRWSFLGPGSEEKWFCTHDSKPQGEWDRVAELMIKFGESTHPVFRATSPLSRATLKSKGGGKLSIHFCADGETIETIFRTLISVSELSIYGAVSELCEEYKALPCRDLCWQNNLTHCLSQQVCWWQHLHLRPKILHKNVYCKSTKNEWKGSHNKIVWLKFCTDAGFLTTVDVGQYLMTMDTEKFSQFAEPVTCREYTSPRDEKSSERKGWIRGNTKIRPVLEVTTSYLQGKYGVEIRIESVNKDNSHSWVRISHGLNKLVRTWTITKRTTTTSRKPLRCSSKILRWKRMYLLSRADQRPKQNLEDVLLLAHLQVLYLSVKDLGLMWSQELIRLSLTQCQNHWVLFFVMVIYLEKKMERLISGVKGRLRYELENSQHWSGEMWKSTMAKEEETRKDFNFVLIRQDKTFFISELSKVILDAIPLILHSRTMC